MISGGAAGLAGGATTVGAGAQPLIPANTKGRNLRVVAPTGSFEVVRALLCLALLGACGPKVSNTTSFNEDLPSERTTTPDDQAQAPIAEAARPIAPPGKGLRSGTIERAKLIAFLDGGPAMFLRQVEITARLDGSRFVGWQLVQLLDHTGPLHDVDVVPGDVLLAVNGKPLSRPDQLQTVWDSLRTANEVRAQLWRGDAKLELAFAIEPAVDASAVPPAPSATPDPVPAPAAAPPPAPTPTPTPTKGAKK